MLFCQHLLLEVWTAHFSRWVLLSEAERVKNTHERWPKVPSGILLAFASHVVSLSFTGKEGGGEVEGNGSSYCARSRLDYLSMPEEGGLQYYCRYVVGTSGIRSTLFWEEGRRNKNIFERRFFTNSVFVISSTLVSNSRMKEGWILSRFFSSAFFTTQNRVCSKRQMIES